MQPQSNQYDFILSPNQPQRSSGMMGANNSMGTRIAIVGGLFVIIIIFFVILMSLFNSGGGSTTKLVTVAQQQQEIVRVATLAATSGVSQSSQNTKNFTENCLLSVTTAQQNLVSYLGTKGKKLDVKQLGLLKNSATDTALTAAIASSSFDSTFTSIMQTQLKMYQTDIKAAYDGTTNAATRQLLVDEYSGAQLLLTQLGSSSSSASSNG